jgi:two-component system cell cycle sensor histidine kinase/response regulator CckA
VSPPRVLLVASSPTIQRSLSPLLAETGLVVTTLAASEADALATGETWHLVVVAQPDGPPERWLAHAEHVVIVGDAPAGASDPRLVFTGADADRAHVVALAREALAGDRGRPTLLTVDDSDTFRALVARKLQDAGFRVVESRSGEEALEMLEREHADAAVVDVQMPGMGGLELVRRLRGDPRWADIPVVMLSGQDDEAAVVRAIESAGADDYVVKSSDIGVLKARVGAQLRRRAAETASRRARDRLAEVLAEQRVAEVRRAHEAQLRQANEELARQRDLVAQLERLQRLVVATTTEAIVALSPDGQVTFANEAAAQLLGVGDLVGRSFHDLVHRDADHGPAECPFLAPARAQAASGMVAHRFRMEGGKEFPVEYTAAPMVEEDGTLVGVGVIWRDITGRTALEEELRHAQKMEIVGRLAARVAHDFNNILTAIQGFASVLQARLGSDPRAEPVEQILAASRRATSLTRQLLAFTRKQLPVARRTTWKEVLEGVRPMLRQLLPDEIALEIDTGDESAVFADPGMLEQVVTNLAVNARDATPPGGVIRLVTSRDDGMAVLLVTDTGTGIPPELMERIFEPFFTTRSSGTGLGLAIVRDIVKQNRGEILVRSEPGNGTTFEIRLPRVEGEVGAAEEPSGGTERVIVVDDDEPVLSYVRTVLEGGGYSVETAANGREALDRIAERRPDLVLTDVVMPELTGPELADRVQERWPGLPVLFMSGYAGSFGGTSARGAHALSKPFSADELLAAVRAALDAVRPS